jgi:hypothetical protein
MAQMIKKSFDSPDETRPIAQGSVEVVNFGDLQPMRTTFEPGWRWSESVIGEIPSGHDAWVIGDEPVVAIDFRGGAIYAKPSS